MKTMFRAAIAAFAMTWGVPAIASPVPYTINFVVTGGAYGGQTLTPPTGSFNYDAAAALGFRFSDFLVTWNTLTFDLTSPANNPYTYGSDCNTDTFTFLSTGRACINPDPNWPSHYWHAGAYLNQGGPFPPNAGMVFVDGSTLGDYFQLTQSLLVTPPTTAEAEGSFSIAQSTPAIPEPATLGLLAAGLAGAGWRRSRAMRRGT